MEESFEMYLNPLSEFNTIEAIAFKKKSTLLPVQYSLRSLDEITQLFDGYLQQPFWIAVRHV